MSKEIVEELEETTAFQCQEEKEPHRENEREGRKDSQNNTSNFEITKFSLYRNLAVVSLSFLLLFAAFRSLLNLQSSINIAEGLGTVGLTVIYVSVLTSSTFLPPLVLSKLGIKWTMVISMFSYLAYIAAAFRATWGTIIPTAFFLGVGAATLWTGQLAFVSELSRQYSNLTNSKLNDILSRFFGIFFLILYTGNVGGNVASSLIFSYKTSENETSSNSTCGTSFCSKEESNNPILLVTDRRKVYMYAGFCLGCGVLAVVLMALLLDNIQSLERIQRSFLTLLTDPLRHIWRSKYQKFLIPVSIYRGLADSFLIGDFNVAFTSCTLGVENVGFVMICRGAGLALTSFVLATLTRKTGYHLPFVIAFLLQASVYIIMFLWTPRKDEAYVIYLCVGLWSVGYSAYSSVLSSLYSYLFPTRRDAAMSCFYLLNSVGMVLSFALSSFLCTVVKLSIVLASSILSTVCVLAVILHDKFNKNKDLSY